MLVLLCIQPLGLLALAKDETQAFHVDAVNGTRWDNYICVYKDVATTKQNEWGYNLVIDASGEIIDKISAGDEEGMDLAVPENGMVLSGTGDRGKEMYNSVHRGDKVLFDEYSMRAYIADEEVDPFYTLGLEFTGYNTVRNSNSVIVYNRAGETTGTNSYGYEVTVDSEGYIISCGGNDSLVPQGGYVISAVDEGMASLKLWFTVGAKCVIDADIITVSYTEAELKRTADTELGLIKAELEEAKAQYRLIDYDAAENAINSVNTDSIETLEQRNQVINQIKAIKAMLLEKPSVQTRGVWYVPTEASVGEIEATVELMKQAGFNELALYVDSPSGTLIPVPETIPFAKDERADSFDLLQTYIDECREKDISLVVVLPVMSNALGKEKTEWMGVDNQGNVTNEFYSPANSEYKTAFTDYLRYILEHYNVDGVQLDYIRYPEFNGSVDFGYDEASVKLFEERANHGADVVKEIGELLGDHKYWETWRSFKAGLINGWVQDCYAIVKELRPDICVSAAVAEGGSLETYCQDFAAWIKGEYIDGIYPMTYVTGINQSTIEKFSAPMTDKSFLVMGCGVYLSFTNEKILEELASSVIYGTDGVGYFEWTAVVDHGYIDFLGNTLFDTPALPITADAEKVAEKLLETAKKRIDLYNGENADQLKGIIADATSDKAGIEAALASGAELLSAEDAEYLLADLKTAARVYNINDIQETDAPDDGGTDNSDGGVNTTAIIASVIYLLIIVIFSVVFIVTRV